MNKILMASLVLLASLWALQSVSAGDTFTISINDSAPHTRYYNDQAGTSIYQFALNPATYNFTSNLSDNASIQEAIMTAQIYEEGDISTTNTYVIEFRTNNTFTLSTKFTYIKENFGFWVANYEFQMLNNSEVLYSCHVSDRAFKGGKMGAPNPAVSHILSFQNAVRYPTGPTLEIGIDDSFNRVRGAKGCNSPDSVGGGLMWVGDTMTTNPAIYVSQGDDQLYRHRIAYEFDTYLGQIEERDANINATNQCGSQTFIIIGFCDLTEGVLWGLNFALGFLDATGDALKQRVPYIGGLIALVLVPLSLFFEVAGVVFSVLFANNETYSLADVMWTHVIYTLTWGAIFAGFTGNVLWLFLTPFYFVKYIVLGFAYAFWAIFIWVPDKSLDVILKIFRGG